MGYISNDLETAMRETLNDDGQVMLFINRRGHSSIVQCKSCGHVMMCHDCSSGLVLHKRSGVLLCHVCGGRHDVPTNCPECKKELSFLGVGVEKIEEEVREKFINARTALVSSDTMTSNKAMEKLIRQIESGEVNIIIGTQILAKGHHFPNLTLVGVIDADSLLFGSDFRASEKTFQQLFQVAGRAGRGDKPGRVLIQTLMPEHPAIKALAESNRDDFIKWDMENRRKASMPPFGQLIAIIIEGTRETELHDFCRALANAAPKINGGPSVGCGRILGPIPAEIYQIRQWYRMRFLVSGGVNAALQGVVSAWLSKVAVPRSVRLKADVNPQSFM